MSFGNQEFGTTRKHQYQIGIWYFVSNFLVFSWYFIGILSTTLLQVGLILIFFGRIKIGLVFGFCSCHFIGIGLVSVCHFPENGISSRYAPGDWRLVTNPSIWAEWGRDGVEWGRVGVEWGRDGLEWGRVGVEDRVRSGQKAGSIPALCTVCA